MPQKLIKLILLVSLMLIYNYSVFAVVRPAVDIHEVCSNAEVIVAGRVGTVDVTDKVVHRAKILLHGQTLLMETNDTRGLQNKSRKEYEFGIWQATVTVKQVIKGQLREKDIIVESFGPKKGRGVIGFVGAFENLHPCEMVVLFLRKNEQNKDTYVFANEFKSAIRIADTPEVTRMLETKAPEGNVEEYIGLLLANSLGKFSGGLFTDSLDDLRALRGKEASSAIKNALDNTKDPFSRGQALVALMNLGDYSRFDDVVDYLYNADDSVLNVTGTKGMLSTRIRSIKDPALIEKYCIPLLMQHPDDFIRRNAAYAIWHAKLTNAVPYLVEGLKDSDQDTRYNCMMGIYETTGKKQPGWAPSTSLFKTNEHEYISKWQGWWDTKGRNEFKEPGEKVPRKIKIKPISIADTNRNSIVENVHQSSTNSLAK